MLTVPLNVVFLTFLKHVNERPSHDYGVIQILYNIDKQHPVAQSHQTRG